MTGICHSHNENLVAAYIKDACLQKQYEFIKLKLFHASPHSKDAACLNEVKFNYLEKHTD